MRCDAEPMCQGFSVSRQGCKIYSDACEDTTIPDGYGFDFPRGLGK